MNWELSKYNNEWAIFCKTSRCYVAFGEKQKLIDETKLPEISPDDIESPVAKARKKESRQALANQGRSSTIATSPQGIADEAVGQIALPSLRRKRISLKTLLGN